MTQANIGGDDLPRSKVTLRDDMDAYDALPPDHRAALRDMSVNWGATGVRKLIEDWSEDTALHVLCKVELDMRRRYRARVGL